MKGKEETGQWVYGINPVLEAIRSGRAITTVYISKQRHEKVEKIIEMAKAKGVHIEFKERDFFDFRFQKGHQGIAAIVIRRRFLNIEDLLSVPASKNEPAFFIILDNIEDPRNFGAILRVADAAGVHGVVFQSHRATGITPIVSKASAGSIEYVNLCEVVNIKHAIRQMKESGIVVIGSEAGAEQTVWDIDMSVPLAIVIGSEGKGMRRTVKETCDLVVSLPMRGKVNSLNVSVASGILSYEVLRQRRIE